MRSIIQRVCWCWFGTPDNHQVFAQLEKELETDSQTEGMVDTSDTSHWQYSDIKGLTPEKIDEKDLTQQYKTESMDTKSVDKMLKKLGYEMSDKIGQGGYGQVYIAYGLDSKGFPVKTTGDEVAIKVMALSDGKYGIRDKRRFNLFRNELFALVKSKHRNIVSVQDNFIINNDCYLVMEFANMGSLQDNIRHNGPFSETVAKDYFGQMSSGIYYLHCVLGFAHFDIKLGNVLMTERKDKKRIVKISDFGLSRLRIDPNEGVIKETDPKGTLAYMSPQVLRLHALHRLKEQSIYAEVKTFNPFIADIWSLGVCLFVMLCREQPFKVEYDARLLREVFAQQKYKKWLTHHKWRQISQKLSIECQDIVEDMLEPNPNKRITIQNIVSHLWFEGMFTIEDLTEPKPPSDN